MFRRPINDSVHACIGCISFMLTKSTRASRPRLCCLSNFSRALAYPTGWFAHGSCSTSQRRKYSHANQKSVFIGWLSTLCSSVNCCVHSSRATYLGSVCGSRKSKLLPCLENALILAHDVTPNSHCYRHFEHLLSLLVPRESALLLVHLQH